MFSLEVSCLPVVQVNFFVSIGWFVVIVRPCNNALAP